MLLGGEIWLIAEVSTAAARAETTRTIEVSKAWASISANKRGEFDVIPIKRYLFDVHRLYFFFWNQLFWWVLCACDVEEEESGASPGAVEPFMWPQMI